MRRQVPTIKQERAQAWDEAVIPGREEPERPPPAEVLAGLSPCGQQSRLPREEAAPAAPCQWVGSCC